MLDYEINAQDPAEMGLLLDEALRQIKSAGLDFEWANLEIEEQHRNAAV